MALAHIVGDEFENRWESDQESREFPVEFVRKALGVAGVDIKEFIYNFHLPAACCQFLVHRLEPNVGRIGWRKTMEGNLIAVDTNTPNVGLSPTGAPFDLQEFINFLKDVRCCVHIH